MIFVHGWPEGGLQAKCIGMRVGRLQRLVSRHFALALRPHGLTIPQLEVLSALVRQGDSLRPTAIADALSVERSTMNRNLALMTEAGWVSAAKVSPTQRAMTVAITRAGTEKLIEARAAWAAAQESLVEKLGEDAPRILDEWLAQLQ